LAAMQMTLPCFLFANGPKFAEIRHDHWAAPERDGSDDVLAEDTALLITGILPAYAGEHLASQVAISVPVGGDAPALLLVAVDETGCVAQQAAVGLGADHLTVEPWRPASTTELPLGLWWRLLALNAGYRDFAKWRCHDCRSVCPGEAEVVPTPCEYCGSEDIERVPLETELAPPR
jgi:hypothetical protein